MVATRLSSPKSRHEVPRTQRTSFAICDLLFAIEQASGEFVLLLPYSMPAPSNERFPVRHAARKKKSLAG